MTTTPLDSPCTSGYFQQRDVYIILDNSVRTPLERRYLHELTMRIAESVPLDGSTVRLDVIALAPVAGASQFSHLRQCSFFDARAVSTFLDSLTTRLDIVDFPLTDALLAINSTSGFGRWHAHPDSAGLNLARHPHTHFSPLILFLTSSRTPSCDLSMFRCDNGMCIDRQRVCNRNLEFNSMPTWPDCSDRSDEPPLVGGVRDYILQCPDRNRVGPIENQICVDVPGWQDAHGANCAAYEAQSYCTPNGAVGSGWNPEWGSMAEHGDGLGRDGLEACCYCGGGNQSTASATPASNLRGLLAETEANLPGTMRELRQTYGAEFEFVAVGDSDRYDLYLNDVLRNVSTTVLPSDVAAFAVNVTQHELCASSAPSANQVYSTCAEILTCPANCGSSQRGGGTCRYRTVDDRALCTSCNDDRFLLRGRCNLRIECRGNVIRYGRLAGMSCRCDQAECFYCSRSSAGDMCFKCRSGYYLLDGRCVPTCPSNMTSSGISLWGRECRVPHACQSNAIGQLDASGEFIPTSGGCKCPEPGNQPEQGCHLCEHRAGEQGAHCLRCRGRQFLYNNSCHSSCAAARAPSAYASYIPGNYGRECRPPFLCRNLVDEQGAACKCPRALGTECVACNFSAVGMACVECRTGFTIANGTCIPSTMPPTATPTQPRPTSMPTQAPTEQPTEEPTLGPTAPPTVLPTAAPSSRPTQMPSAQPSGSPTSVPTSLRPTMPPTNRPTVPNCNGHPDLAGCDSLIQQITCNAPGATDVCTVACGACTTPPTIAPTAEPTSRPSASPTVSPTVTPTEVPTAAPTANPSDAPTEFPTHSPTDSPTSPPTANPTDLPTFPPTRTPTSTPTPQPTVRPTTTQPTNAPSASPTESPSAVPTIVPTRAPTTVAPTAVPSAAPTVFPTASPTNNPTASPTTLSPTNHPTEAPTMPPTPAPTAAPIAVPTVAPSIPTCNGNADPFGCAADVEQNGCTPAAVILCPAHCGCPSNSPP